MRVPFPDQFSEQFLPFVSIGEKVLKTRAMPRLDVGGDVEHLHAGIVHIENGTVQGGHHDHVLGSLEDAAIFAFGIAQLPRPLLDDPLEVAVQIDELAVGFLKRPLIALNLLVDPPGPFEKEGDRSHDHEDHGIDGAAQGLKRQPEVAVAAGEKQPPDDVPDRARQAEGGQGIAEPEEVGPDDVVGIGAAEAHGHAYREEGENADEAGPDKIGKPYGQQRQSHEASSCGEAGFIRRGKLPRLAPGSGIFPRRWGERPRFFRLGKQAAQAEIKEDHARGAPEMVHLAEIVEDGQEFDGSGRIESIHARCRDRSG